MAVQGPVIRFREPYRHKIDYPDGDREEAYADAVAEGIAPEQAALLLTAPSFLECIRRDGRLQVLSPGSKHFADSVT